MVELTYHLYVQPEIPELEAWWVEDEHLGGFLQETESRRQLRLKEDYQTNLKGL